MISLLTYLKSHVGLIREINEDSYLTDPPHLFAIADGMGGHVAGEVASRRAIDVLKQAMNQAISDPYSRRDQLVSAVQSANSQIYDLALKNQQFSGMGTTLTACYIDQSDVFWAHVGDSRLYLLHEGNLRQITQDHSLVAELLRIGSITPKEAFVHPKRNILTQAIGTNKAVQVDSGTLVWNPGDTILLCTDGLCGLVEEEYLQSTLNNNNLTLTEKGDSLFEQALAAGGSDNITLILLHNSISGDFE